MVQGLEVRDKPRQCRRRAYRRRAILLSDVTSVSVYLEMVAEKKVPVPVLCPDGCAGCRLSWHSRFEREWVDYDCLSFTVVILRVRCSVCHAVWSLFPAFVWYRRKFAYRLVQTACWRALSGECSNVIAESLEPTDPELATRLRVPAESTIRSWVRWLGQRELVVYVRWSVSFITIRDPEAGRVAMRLCASRIDRVRERAVTFLLACAALDGVLKGRGGDNLFRRAPNQLRDWALVLYCERREVLARPP